MHDGRGVLLMRLPRLVGWGAVLLFALTCPVVGRGEAITVLLIRAADGGPAAHQKVEVSLGDPSQPSTRVLTGITSKTGKAVFDLPEPFPSHLFVDVENGRIRACARELLVLTAKVMRSGIIEGNNCKPRRKFPDIKAQPGEIILFVHPLSLWDKLQK